MARFRSPSARQKLTKPQKAPESCCLPSREPQTAFSRDGLPGPWQPQCLGLGSGSQNSAAGFKRLQTSSPDPMVACGAHAESKTGRPSQKLPHDHQSQQHHHNEELRPHPRMPRQSSIKSVFYNLSLLARCRPILPIPPIGSPHQN